MVGMDYFGWLWVVALCFWLARASTMNDMGRKVLNDLERVSPIVLEMGCWETFFVCMGCSCNIRYRGYIYGEIKEHGERKGHQLFYGASREKTKGRYFVDCEKGKRKDKRFFVRERGRK